MLFRSHDVENLKIRTTPLQDKPTESLNSLSIQINNNDRMLARLHARWAREEEEARIAEMNSKTVNVYTIQTTNRDPPSLFKDDDIDFDNCNLTEVIKFLQKIAKAPDASKLNIAFTKHIIGALIKAREEKLQLENSIPRKLQDSWEPSIKMKINDLNCNALCDIGDRKSVV